MSDHKSFEAAVLLRSEDSAGAVALIDNRVPARWEGPPLHHHAFDEALYVLEGELTFQLGGELVSADPGQFVFAPADAHHTLANLGDAQARYLLMCTPGGFERYFEGLEPIPRSHASDRGSARRRTWLRRGRWTPSPGE